MTKGPERFGVIASRYNEAITDRLVEGAVRTLVNDGVDQASIDVYRVPGAWEIPLAAQWLVDTTRYRGIIALGAVIKGETTHDEHINRFVSLAVGELSLQEGIPIAFGLLTCNTLQQAVERAGGKVGNKGVEAAEAVLEMLKVKSQIDGT
jgi:6,7-dimethyl-8-ribityllumazine synthase